jgi:hypothetical protein
MDSNRFNNIFFIYYIIKSKEQFKMNKISNDKIEKKSNKKIQQKPNIKDETGKKTKKK